MKNKLFAFALILLVCLSVCFPTHCQVSEKDSSKVVIDYRPAMAIYNRLTVCDTIEAAYSATKSVASLAMAESKLKTAVIDRKSANEADLRQMVLLSDQQLSQYRQLSAQLQGDNARLKTRARNNFWYGLLGGIAAALGGVVLLK